jgi:hypothetical protein
MCRLVFASADYVRATSLADLEHLFVFLEEELGGHGCGYAYRVPGRARLVGRKGVTLSPAACAAGWYEGVMRGASELLFHTRIASAGAVCDALCHPFIHGLTGLAHNGHDSRYVYSNNAGSDSFHIAWELASNMLTAQDLHTLNGTFVGWAHGVPFIQAAAWTDCELTYRGTGWLCASTIPPFLAAPETVYIAYGYDWVGRRDRHGKLVDIPPVPTTTVEDLCRAYESRRVAQKYLPAPATKYHLSDGALLRMTDDEYTEYLDARELGRKG